MFSRIVREILAKHVVICFDWRICLATLAHNFIPNRYIGELQICWLSKFQLNTTLGGRNDVEKPKRKIVRKFANFGARLPIQLVAFVLDTGEAHTELCTADPTKCALPWRPKSPKCALSSWFVCLFGCSFVLSFVCCLSR